MSSKNSRTIAIALTSLAWTILIVLSGWVFMATGWWLLFALWHKQFALPNSIRETVRVLAEIALWGVAVFGGLLFWANFNRKRYFLKNQRRLEEIPLQARDLPGPEALIVIEDKESKDGLKLSRSNIVWQSNCSRIKKLASPSVQMLSDIKVFNKEHSFRDAASLARLVVINPETPTAIRFFAYQELAFALSHLGKAGEALSESLRFKMESGWHACKQAE